jgi:predicted O-methyltransferase YrrM
MDPIRVAHEKYNKCHVELPSGNIEGGSIPEQSEFFINYLLQNPHIKLILEIGFNAGNSANAFLSARDDIKVISVDIGEHLYIKDAKEVINKYYPERHALIVGDSKLVIPEILKTYDPPITPELIFIDGDHSEPTPLIDARNCLKLAGPNTILVMDDTTINMGWAGVLQAMCELVKGKEIDPTYVNSYTVRNRGWTLFRRA